MKDALLGLFAYIIVGIVSVLTMMYGWGLAPQSWAWIVGGYLTMFLPAAILAVAKS